VTSIDVTWLAVTLELRIDELARKARTTTRNVRAYASRKLLPPPTLKGRTAFYGEPHLGRLRLISRLVERGFSLASISELLGAWQQHKNLNDLLGLESAVTTPSLGEPRFVSKAELKVLAPELAKSPKLLARAVKLQLLQPERGGWRVLNERAMHVGRALGDAGLEPQAVLDTLGPLRAALEPVAELFVQLFRRQLWAPFIAAGAPPGELASLTERLERLRPVAGQAVEAVLSQVLDRAISDAAARELAILPRQVTP
jgi:DNA-binding transcriptional MerR regulator